MKITSAKVIVCSPGRNFVTLKIETDQGLTGLGDATLNGRELAVASYLNDHVIPCLIGRDAHQIEDIWQYLHARHTRGRQEVLAAMVGPDGEAEMRLTRMSGADLRRDKMHRNIMLRAGVVASIIE